MTYRGTTTVNGPAGPLAGTGEPGGHRRRDLPDLLRARRARLAGDPDGGQHGVRVRRRADDARPPAVRRREGRPAPWQVAGGAPSQARVRATWRSLLPDDSRFEGFEDAGTGQVRGAAVRRFTGEDDDGSAMTVSVAIDGPPLLLAVETARGGASRLRAWSRTTAA
ncbi:hypothetical protein G5V59_18385 [Nocardioides sp. W3-2-3]|uniref:hypothetical protein n=1 Tax=Nocardioides convexus TaxID=2712224 RepID=UPI002418ABD2|nr:hypothetical protein [Nocardioides convexus]NHA01161.1 hypothetical protein [Nocardioides convexus]